jgi:hypothetical protein
VGCEMMIPEFLSRCKKQYWEKAIFKDDWKKSTISSSSIGLLPSRQTHSSRVHEKEDSILTSYFFFSA